VTLALPIAAVAIPIAIALTIALMQWCGVCTGSESAVEARMQERMKSQGMGVGFAGVVAATDGNVGASNSRLTSDRRRRRHGAVLQSSAMPG